MSENTITIMTWNVSESSFREDRSKSQIQFIKNENPDVVCLQAVRHSSSDKPDFDRSYIEEWKEGLTESDFTTVKHTADWAIDLGESKTYPHHMANHHKCNLTAVREETMGKVRPRYSEEDLFLNREVYKQMNRVFPEKILVTRWHRAEGTVPIEIWNIGIPYGGGFNNVNNNSNDCDKCGHEFEYRGGNSGWGEEKIKALEFVYDKVQKSLSKGKQLIICGDFNAPDKVDNKFITYNSTSKNYLSGRLESSERNIIEGIPEMGMHNVALNSNLQNPSTKVNDGKPKLWDHIFVPGRCKIESVAIRKEEMTELDIYDYDGKQLSDHAPIIAEVKMT